jgi:hypothetical protein
MLNRLHRIRHENADAGITLMELIVSMALMTICGTMTLFFFTGMNTASNTTVDANVATAKARTTLQEWTTLLNLADSSSSAGSGTNRFVEITPTSATFYSNVDLNRSTSGSARTAPQKVELSLENSQLVERDYSADSGSLTATRYLADDVSRSGGAWLFTPYCAITAAGTGTVTGVGSCTSTASGSSALATVSRIDIAFTLTVDSSSQSFTSSAAITGST